MKLSYTDSEIDRWRKKSQRRLLRWGPQSTAHVVEFMDDVGFCFASKGESTELPSLWFASRGWNGITRGESENALLATERVYYGRVLRRRPTLISPEYLPYFYALQGHHGKRDDFVREYTLGRLSMDGKIVMNQLVRASSRSSRELREEWPGSPLTDIRRLERAMMELELKLFITRVHSHESRHSSWSTVHESFPAAVRKARRITAESARAEILKRFFRNQLVVTVGDIHHVLGWKKPAIYQALGALVQSGHISPHAKVNGMNTNYYCLVH